MGVLEAERDDATADAALAAGWAMQAAGCHLAALERFDAAVAANPGAAEGHAGRGEALLGLGRADEAAQAWERACALDPACAAWAQGYAQALEAAGRPEDAVGILRMLLEFRPGHAATLARLGGLLERLGDGDAAIAAHREATYAGAGRESILPLGRLLLERERPVEAISWLQRCLRLDPDDCEAHARLGAAYAAIAERERARYHLRRALEIDPANPYDCAIVLAQVEEERPQALPRAYTRALFDQYAERFDEHLLGTLNYSGHRLVAAALADALGAAAPVDRLIDLGCGTGLAGPGLRPLARRLAGVDLSAGMIAQARARGIYDELRVGELIEVLQGSPRSWDAAVAADVVAYLGDLGPLMQALSTALRSGGLFAATAEQADGDEDVRLKPTRRFGHSDGHIRSRARAAGLEVLRLEPASARTERTKPVQGWLFVLRRP